MAAVPTGSSFNFGAFFVQLGASYLVGRLTAQDGPRLGNLQAAGGEYGVGMPRLYGEAVRATGIFLAQDDIKETKHKVEDYSELVGAATGAIQGFMVGGPVGAVAGAVIGGLLGAATPNQKYYTYSDTFALLFADRLGDDPIEGITTLWAGGKVIFRANESSLVSETIDAHGLVKRKYAKNRWYKSLTIYGGGPTQDVDPILAATVDEDSGYRHLAYVVIEDLQLASFGQSVPTVEGLVVAKTGQSLSDVVEAICASAGVDSKREVSTTALTDRSVRGYQVAGESSCWDALKPLLPVFRVDAAEVSGQVRFYRREQAMRSVIPVEDMGAHVYGDDPPEPFRFKRSTDIDLPRETSVTFIDPARDHQPNTASSQRSEGAAKSNVSISLPLTLSADEGAAAAATMHWDAWLGRSQSDFTLTDKWIGLEPGIAYGIAVAGTVVPFRIKRKARGANGVIEVEAVSDESVAYQAVVAGAPGELPDGESTLFAQTRVVAMDMPIVGDGHDDYGFYIAVGGGEAYWERGWVEASGNGAQFARIVDASTDTVVGDVTGALAAGPTTGLDDTLDATSVLTVTLLHDGMTLASATDAELDAWANFAFVGKNGLGEYLQFKTATKVGTATWELTNLRRGRKGTDHAIGGHVAGEEFALLGGPGVFRIVYADTAKWGQALTLRGVTLHQDSADADSIAFTNTGEGKRPYSPVNVVGTWDASNNLTATFDARSRMNSGGLGVDDNAEWEVEITSGVGRTILTLTESFAYSATDQTADGLTPGGVVTGRVRQTSDVNHGRWRDFVLVGPGADVLLLEDNATTIHAEDGATPIEAE